MSDQKLIRRAVVASVVLFITFGLPDGAFGTLWPNIRDHFGRTDASLGLSILATAVGYFVGGFTSGRVTARVGIGRTLPAAMTGGTVGLLIVAGAPTFGVVLLGYLVVGIVWGIADSAANTWMTLTQGTREIGLLHAAYGIGAFLGPLLATVFVADSTAWRQPLVICAIFTGAGAALLLGSRRGFEIARVTPDVAAKTGDEPGTDRLVVVLIAWFIAYAGVEVSIGSWAYTLLSEGRGVSNVAAGVTTALYWGGLTAGRLVLAVVGNRTRPEATMTVGSAIAVAALAFLWVDPGGTGGVALPVIGFAIGPMFPILIERTGVYLGERRAARAVGYQIGSTAIGFITIPALIGVLADRHGIGVSAAVVFVNMAVVAAIWMWIKRTATPGRGTKDRRRSVSSR